MSLSTTDSVYCYVAAYLNENGHAPTQREIAKACYLSQSSVRYHLLKLKFQGRVAHAEGRARGLSLAVA